MKKITSLLIVCSLALAGAVMAQEPSPEQSPNKKQGPPKKEQPAVTKPTTHAPKSETPALKEQPATNQAPTMTAPPTTMPETKGPKNKKNKPETTPKTNAEQSATNATASATPDVTKNKSSRNNKNSKTPAANASTTPAAGETPASTPSRSPKTNAKSKMTATPAPTTATSPAAATTPAMSTPATAATTTPAAATTTTPATAPSTSPAPSVSTSTAASTNAAGTKQKPAPQQIQQIRQQHQSFRAQPKPQVVPAVTFNPGYRIQGSEQWQGPQYEVYRSYHPERHDRGWYSQHYQRVELIAGGYYYFNSGYWYPAWGYDPGHEYYAYDAPIYVGKRSEPPDRVIADVQAALQEMGYYKGEVDGLIGPLTREALTAYQADNGMTVTAVIDEPTLDSLGMG